MTAFTEPDLHGFLCLGSRSARPAHGPFPRRDGDRRTRLRELVSVADGIAARADVVSARVFRASLMPPISGAPRHDLVLLVRTATPELLTDVRNDPHLTSVQLDLILGGVCVAKIGETEDRADGAILFNHFASDGAVDPLDVWLDVTDWYTEKLGVDNSTALKSTHQSLFPFVNYVRLPTAPLPFLLAQLLRPSFHRVVRRRLAASKVRALPVFHQVAHVASANRGD